MSRAYLTQAVAASVVIVLVTHPKAYATGNPAAIEARLKALEAEIAQLRKEARAARSQAQVASPNFGRPMRAGS